MNVQDYQASLFILSGGNDDPVDVPAHVGRETAHPGYSKAAAPLDRQTALLSHYSRSDSYFYGLSPYLALLPAITSI